MLNRFAFPNSSEIGIAYAADNKRIWERRSPSQDVYEERAMFYGIDGMRLGIYEVVNATSTTLEFRKLTESTYFGSKLIAQRDKNGTTERVMTDRLGSVVLRGSTRFTYYPYGEEKGTPTTNDREKFGTYYRDTLTGWDYADQRYYNTGFGRFGIARLSVESCDSRLIHFTTPFSV